MRDEEAADLLKRLYREHAALVDKKFVEGFSALEQQRLDEVREEIDALEDWQAKRALLARARRCSWIRFSNKRKDGER